MNIAGHVRKKASTEISFAENGKFYSDDEEPTKENKRVIEINDPLDAMSLNYQQDKVVVAGTRGVLQVIKIVKESGSVPEGPFIVKESDLLSHKRGRVNILHSASNVSWNKQIEDHIATTSSNGSIVIWNSTRKNNKQIVYKAHERSATCIDWNSDNPHIIISGSRDCHVFAYDIRLTEGKILDFCDGTCEAVRDLCFVNHPGYQNYFFTGDDSGALRLWDLRTTKRWVLQRTAHNSFVSTISVNPNERNMLATGGGRDKLVKVWNWSSDKIERQNVVETMAPLGRVVWRPDNKYQIATCASVNDMNIHVWDIRRPYLPYATYDEHRDSVTDTCWPTVETSSFLSCGKDGSLVLHAIDSGHAPISYACDVPFDVTPDGVLGIAVNLHLPWKVMSEMEPIPLAAKQPSRAVYSRKRNRRKVPYESFGAPIRSLMTCGVPKSSQNSLQPNAFFELAKRYYLGGRPLAKICAHNAKIANMFGKDHVVQTWRLVEGLIIKADLQRIYDEDEEKAKIEFERKWNIMKREMANEGRRTLPTYNEISMQIKKRIYADRMESIIMYRDWHKAVGESDMSDINSDSEEEDDEESFDSERDGDESSSVAGEDKPDKKRKRQKSNTSISEFYFGGGESNLKVADPQKEVLYLNEFMGLRDEAFELRTLFNENNGKLEQKDNNWTPMFEVMRLLRYHAEQGDMQTCASVAIVCGKKLFEVADTYTLGTWIDSYLEMCNRLELYLTCARIRKYCAIYRIRQMSREGTNVEVQHSKCGRPITNGRCQSCEKVAAPICTLCLRPVFGLLYECCVCFHAMHPNHAADWFKSSRKCAEPGCLCRCRESSYPIMQRHYIKNEGVPMKKNKLNEEDIETSFSKFIGMKDRDIKVDARRYEYDPTEMHSDLMEQTSVVCQVPRKKSKKKVMEVESDDGTIPKEIQDVLDSTEDGSVDDEHVSEEELEETEEVQKEPYFDRDEWKDKYNYCLEYVQNYQKESNGHEARSKSADFDERRLESGRVKQSSPVKIVQSVSKDPLVGRSASSYDSTSSVLTVINTKASIPVMVPRQKSRPPSANIIDDELIEDEELKEPDPLEKLLKIDDNIAEEASMASKCKKADSRLSSCQKSTRRGKTMSRLSSSDDDSDISLNGDNRNFTMKNLMPRPRIINEVVVCKKKMTEVERLCVNEQFRLLRRKKYETIVEMTAREKMIFLDFVKLFFFIPWNQIDKSMDCDVILRDIYDAWQHFSKARKSTCGIHYMDYVYNLYAKIIVSRMFSEIFRDVRQRELSSILTTPHPIADLSREDQLNYIADKVLEIRRDSFVINCLKYKLKPCLVDLKDDEALKEKIGIKQEKKEEERTNYWELFQEKKKEDGVPFEEHDEKLEKLFARMKRREILLKPTWRIKVEVLSEKRRRLIEQLEKSRGKNNRRVRYDNKILTLCAESKRRMQSKKRIRSRSIGALQVASRRWNAIEQHRLEYNGKEFVRTEVFDAMETARKSRSFKTFLTRLTNLKFLSKEYHQMLEYDPLNGNVLLRRKLGTIVEETEEMLFWEEVLAKASGHVEVVKDKLKSAEKFAIKRYEEQCKLIEAKKSLAAHNRDTSLSSIARRNFKWELEQRLTKAQDIILKAKELVENDVHLWMIHEYNHHRKRRLEAIRRRAKRISDDETLSNFDDSSWEESGSSIVTLKVENKSEICDASAIPPRIPINSLDFVGRVESEVDTDTLTSDGTTPVTPSDDDSVTTWFDEYRDFTTEKIAWKDYEDEMRVVKERTKGAMANSDRLIESFYGLENNEESCENKEDRRLMRRLKRKDERKTVYERRMNIHDYEDKVTDDVRFIITELHRAELRRVGNRIQKEMRYKYLEEIERTRKIIQRMPYDIRSYDYELFMRDLLKNKCINKNDLKRIIRESRKELMPLFECGLKIGVPGIYIVQLVQRKLLDCYMVRRVACWLLRQLTTDMKMSRWRLKMMVDMVWRESRGRLDEFMRIVRGYVENSANNQLDTLMDMVVTNPNEIEEIADVYDEITVCDVLNEIICEIEHFELDKKCLEEDCSNKQLKKIYKEANIEDWIRWRMRANEEEDDEDDLLVEEEVEDYMSEKGGSQVTAIPIDSGRMDKFWIGSYESEPIPDMSDEEFLQDDCYEASDEAEGEESEDIEDEAVIGFCEDEKGLDKDDVLEFTGIDRKIDEKLYKISFCEYKKKRRRIRWTRIRQEDDRLSYSSMSNCLSHELYFSREFPEFRAPACIVQFSSFTFFGQTDVEQRHRWEKIIEISDSQKTFYRLLKRQRLVDDSRERFMEQLTEMLGSTKNRLSEIDELFDKCTIHVIVDTKMKPWVLHVDSYEDKYRMEARGCIGVQRKELLEKFQNSFEKWKRLCLVDTERLNSIPIVAEVSQEIEANYGKVMDEIVMDENVFDDWHMVKKKEGVKALDALIRAPAEKKTNPVLKEIFAPIYEKWIEEWKRLNEDLLEEKAYVDENEEVENRIKLMMNYAYQYYRMIKFDPVLSKTKCKDFAIRFPTFRQDVPSSALLGNLHRVLHDYIKNESSKLPPSKREEVISQLVNISKKGNPNDEWVYMPKAHHGDAEILDEELLGLGSIDDIKSTTTAPAIDSDDEMNDCQKELQMIRSVYESRDMNRRRFVANTCFEIAERLVKRFCPDAANIEMARKKFDSLLSKHARQRPLLDMMLTTIDVNNRSRQEIDFLMEHKLVGAYKMELRGASAENDLAYHHSLPASRCSIGTELDEELNLSHLNGTKAMNEPFRSVSESSSIEVLPTDELSDIGKIEGECLSSSSESEGEVDEEKLIGEHAWKRRKRVGKHFSAIAKLDRHDVYRKLNRRLKSQIDRITEIIRANCDEAHPSWGKLHKVARWEHVPRMEQCNERQFLMIKKGRVMFDAEPQETPVLGKLDQSDNGSKYFT